TRPPKRNTFTLRPSWITLVGRPPGAGPAKGPGSRDSVRRASKSLETLGSPGRGGKASCRRSKPCLPPGHPCLANSSGPHIQGSELCRTGIRHYLDLDTCDGANHASLMLEALVALAATAAGSVVQSMATDAWSVARNGIARLFGRQSEARKAAIETQL